MSPLKKQDESNKKKTTSKIDNSLADSNKKSAISSFLDMKNEEYSSIRKSQITEAIGNLKSKIKSISLPTKSPAVNNTMVDAKGKSKDKLLSIADKAHSIYRTEINPKIEEIPSTHASRVEFEARVNSKLGIRNGGNSGRSTYSNENGAGNTGGVNSKNFGLYPTTLTIEEYQEYINSIFEDITPSKDNKEESLKIKEPIQKEDKESSEAVSKLEKELLQLEDTSWQSIDTLMRNICKEYEITPKELHNQFKSTHGIIPDEWVKQQESVEYCGWFPINEVTFLNKVGQLYQVTFIFRGLMQRQKFFWPEIGSPTRQKMQKTVEKFYPSAKLVTFYPSMDKSTDNMVILSTMREDYIPLQVEDWGLMSEDASLVYENICDTVGTPLSPPCLVEDNVYEVVVENKDNEIQRIRFEDLGNTEGGRYYCMKELASPKKDDNGFSSCWDGYVKKGTKKKGGKTVNNCVKEEGPSLAVGRGEKLSPEAGGGLTQKGREKYNRATGSNLKAPVTSDNPGPKDKARRKSFCARSASWDGERGIAARKRWKC